MRKKSFIILLIVLSLSLIGSSQASLYGVEYKYFPKESLLKRSLSLESPLLIGDIIILPETPFDQLEAAKMVKRIDGLPDSLLKKITEHEIKIKLFEGQLTDNPTVRHLSGLTPRGYKSDIKWDAVPGIGGSKLVLVKIGHSEKGKGHGSVNLELHELAHSIDRYVFNGIRTNPHFLKIWELEKRNLFPGKDYFLLFPEEYFAETFAMYFYSNEMKEVIKIKAPLTFQFLQNLK